MSRIKPLTIPPVPELVYDQVRVSMLTVHQERVGAPVGVTYQLDWYAVTPGGPIDAPHYTAVEGTISYPIDQVLADKGLAMLVASLTERAIADAVRKGRLTLTP